MSQHLQKFRVEAAWQLGQWEDLDDIDFSSQESW
jgi:hypothetical protein